MAAGVLEMGYADEIDIGSNTLPHGTNVTIRVRLSYQAGRSATRTWPEWVTVPPTEPGGATTYVQVFRSSSDSEFRTPSTHEAGFQTLRPDGTQQGFVRAERKLAGAVEFNLTAVVGGKLRLTHAFVTHGLEAATRARTGSHGGDRSAALSSTGVCFLNLWPVTDGVRLTSRSGAVYAPATGQGALLQSQVLGENLQLIAPDGAIFQKATSWPASEGLSWTDLPDRQLLLVPMNESNSFFRVRLP